MAGQNDPYAPHEGFIAPAVAKPDPWRIGVMLIGFEVILWGVYFIAYGIIGQLPLNTFTRSLTEAQPLPVLDAEATPIGTIVVFAGFGVMLFLFLKLLRKVHGRGLLSLLGPLDWVLQDFRRCFPAVFALLLVGVILFPFAPWDSMIEIRRPLVWIILAPIGFLAILIQCATEEIVYRGYLQQQIGALTKNRAIYIGVPAVLFGLGHFWNGYGLSDSILYVIWTTFLGLALGDLTARTGSLGAAIGVHTALNVTWTMLLGEHGGPASGLALFLSEPYDWESFDYSIDLLFSSWGFFGVTQYGLLALVLWLVARVRLRR